MKRACVAAAAAFALATAAGTPAWAQVDVSIDLQTEGITIDGFGGFGAMMPWWFGGPFYTDAFLDLLLDSLGLTILRTEPYPIPDQEEMYTKQIPYLRAIKQRADEKGIDLKVLGSIWTPPASMKTNNHTTGGNLKPSEYSNYGKYLVDYVRRFRQDMGYDMYALSPQNEPALSTGYNSCSFLPDEFAAMFKAVAAEFKAAGEEINLTYADNITWGGNGWLGSVFNEMANDRVADSMGNILSCHYSYHGDVAGNINYFSPLNGWAQERTQRLGGANRTMVWNTEFNGMYNSWEERWENTHEGGAWAFATDFFMTLQFDFTAVIMWALVDPLEGRKEEDNHYSLFYSRNSTEMVIGPLFRLAQTVFRTVRPGAIKVGATSANNAAVWAVAYKHPGEQTTTIVLMNRADSPQTVSLSGAGLPAEFTLFQTSPTQDFENMGSVSSSATITLPVKSLGALYTVPDQTGVRPVRGAAASAPGHLGGNGVAPRSFSLTGRSLDYRAPARGVILSTQGATTPARRVVLP